MRRNTRSSEIGDFQIHEHNSECVVWASFLPKRGIIVQHEVLLFFLKNRRQCAVNLCHAFMIAYDQHAVIPVECISHM